MKSAECCSIFQIFSTLKGVNKKFVKPLKDIHSWYACGPTVYDVPHIGHAKTYVQFDIIKKIFRNYGYNFIQAMSITDIDDKVIKRCNEVNVSIAALTKMYEEDFFNEMQRFNVEPPDIKLRVSEYIQYIQLYIKTLLDNDSAYLACDGSVYFNMTNYKHKYGQFRDANLDQNTGVDELGRRHKADFALWKACKTDQEFGWTSNYWNSPRLKGRPGWHIECSVMSNFTFGPHLDIHSGGQDLIFPHHENELAQCTAFYQSSPSIAPKTGEWVDFWMHSGHLRNVNQEEKMSKSLKNTIAIGEFMREGKYNSDHFRLMCLAHHYRRELAFDRAKTMEPFVKMLEKIDDFLHTTKVYASCGSNEAKMGPDTCSINEPHLEQCLVETQNLVDKSLTNDFDTPTALRALLNLMDQASSPTKSSNSNIPLFYSRAPFIMSKIRAFVENTFRVFGLTFGEAVKNMSHGRETGIVNEALKLRGTVREVALQMTAPNVDVGEASKRLLLASDGLRNSYQNLGINMKDTSKSSTSWKYSVKQHVPSV